MTVDSKSQHLRADPAAIAEALRQLILPGAVTELRMPGTTHGTVSGYFTDLEALARAGATGSGKAAGVYITVNPVRPELLARATNRVVEYAKHTTADTDIQARRWLPFDFDPARPAGISSTEAEHRAAIARAMAGRDWLISQGWPAAALILADSGNGAHLVARIGLPNTAEATALVKRCLEVMALHFGDDEVLVDQTTHNAARIWKLYGTLAAKGDASEERPHRLARVLGAAPDAAVVPNECLARLAALAPQEPPRAAGKNKGAGLDLEAWIAEHHLPVVQAGAWMSGRKWLLSPCPWDSAHTNRAAYIVQFGSGAIAAGCHHNGCAGKSWADLRQLYEPAGGRRAGAPGSGAEDGDEDAVAVGPYEMTDAGITWQRDTRDGVVPTRLTNFAAHIVGDVAEDDGSGDDLRRLFEIETTLNGRVARFELPAARFAAMGWPAEYLGASALLYPGNAIKDHARAAIQMFSADVQGRRVFTHAGWRRVDGRLVYLHAGGAICSEGALTGVEVALPGALARFELPEPPGASQLRTALQASLMVLDVAPDRLTIPLLASTYGGPLSAVDFSVHYAGQRGQERASWWHWGSSTTARR